MARPTISEVFGDGARVEVDVDGNASLVVPFSSLGVDSGQNFQASDPQALWALLTVKVSQRLNESNRGTAPDDIQTTLSYGEYDVIFDPPGSSQLVRRDVYSVIFYNPQSPSPFDPLSMAS